MNDGICDKEWKIFSNYRSKRIHTGLTEFYANSDDAMCSKLRVRCGNSRYLWLAA
ncbi:MAG: hypothetical protein IJU48_02220 [Synergistaceae bacterium]|nr:hypothetical protein [Synergistaceae bacterium]